MNIFSDAAREKAEEAARQIRADHERDTTQAALARDIADQLMNYLVDHPALQVVNVGFEGNVVLLHKTVTHRSLQIICDDAHMFRLVEKGPELQTQVSVQPSRGVPSGTITKAEMIDEVISWLKQ